MLSYENAIIINKSIDFLHNPTWTVWFCVSLIFIYEAYREVNLISFRNQLLSNIIAKFKIISLALFSIVAITQAVLNGCFFHIIQNSLASNYLDMEYWHPYGLVYREFFSPSLYPILRIIYLCVGIIYLIAFIKVKRIQKSKSS